MRREKYEDDYEDEEDYDYDDRHDRRSPNVIVSAFRFIKHIFSSIRSFITFIIILVQILIVGVILTLIFKPPKLWNPIKSYLNDNVKAQQTDVKLEDIYTKINNSQGIEIISLDSDEVGLLLEESYSQFDNIDVVLDQDSLQLFFNIDKSQEYPLWIKTEFEEMSDHGLRLQSIGFVKYNIPESFVSKITSNEYTIGILDILNKESVEDMVSQVIDNDLLSTDITITSATISQGELVLVVENHQSSLANNN